MAIKKLILSFSYWFNKLSFPKFLFLFCAVLFLKNGIWPIPNIGHFYLLSKDLTVNPFVNEPQAHYILGSYLGPIISNIAGLNQSLFAFLGMHIFFLILSVGILAYLTYRNGVPFSKLALSLFLALPISSTLLIWVGYDVFTFLFSTLAVLVPNPIVGVFAGVLLGANHFEQMITSFGLLFLIKSALDLQFFKNKFLPPLLGILLGKLLLLSWFRSHDIHLESSRLQFVLETGLPPLLKADLRSLLPFLFSLFAGGWILTTEWIASMKRNRKELILFVLPLVVVVLISLLGMDETRVFALISWPLLLNHLVRENFEGRIASPVSFPRKNLAAYLFLAGAILPPIIVWGGKVQSTTLFYSLGLLLDTVLNTRHTIESHPSWTLLPFL